ncbi:MAG: hypothetical protein N3F63_00320 [Thermoplasmata archaeon]|nr:hypothetical protein [Thermoplasmata archaeon]
MKRSEAALLVFLFLFSLCVHLFPLTQHLIWGSDTGEYYFLTHRLVDQGHITTDYEGWGFGYPYFQGMFIVSGSFTVSTGITIFDTVRILAPVIASFGAIFVFLTGRKIFGKTGAGLLAAILLSVSMPYVFPTSHPMPGAIGNMLLVFIFLAFLKTREDKKFYAIAFLGMPAIAITHHLSAFLLFLSLLCTAFLMHQYLRNQREYLKLDVLLVLFAYLVFIYLWVFAGGAFNEFIVKVGLLGAEPEYVAIAGTGIFPLLYLLLRKRFLKKIFAYRGKFLSFKAALLRVLACIMVILIIFVPLVFVQIPGTTITLTPEMLLLFLPLMVLYSFATVGSKLADIFPSGIALFGLLGGVTLSLLAGVFMVPEVLIPYRHIEYLLLPLSVCAGAGASYMYRILGNARKIFAVFIGVLCLLAVPSVYPDKATMAGFQEGTSTGEFEGALWTRLAPGVYASDHRMSSMIFGFGGMYATWDTTPQTFFNTDLNLTLEELASAKAPHKERPVNYVLLTEDMKTGCAMSPLEQAKPIPVEVEEKFSNPPFVKVYDNGIVQIYKTGI